MDITLVLVSINNVKKRLFTIKYEVISYKFVIVIV